MRQAIVLGLSLLSPLLAACSGSVDVEGPAASRQSPEISMPSRPTPLPTPHTCVAHGVLWTTDGGWAIPGYRASSTITGCRTYERVYYPKGRDGGAERCRVELESAGASSLEELSEAMDRKEVQSAFARGGDVGKLQSPSDGIDDFVFLHGGRLLIGDDAPAPVQRLVDLLRAIDEKECPQAAR